MLRRCNPIVERLARRLHEDWLAIMHAAGVASRKSIHGDEQILPWDELTERVRESNRETVRRFFQALADEAAQEK